MIKYGAVQMKPKNASTGHAEFRGVFSGGSFELRPLAAASKASFKAIVAGSVFVIPSLYNDLKKTRYNQ